MKLEDHIAFLRIRPWLYRRNSHVKSSNSMMRTFLLICAWYMFILMHRGMAGGRLPITVVRPAKVTIPALIEDIEDIFWIQWFYSHFLGNTLLMFTMLKIRNIFIGPTYKLLLSFMVISKVYMSSIVNKTAFTTYCLTRWISKLPGSFEIHRVR